MQLTSSACCTLPVSALEWRELSSQISYHWIHMAMLLMTSDLSINGHYLECNRPPTSQHLTSVTSQ